MVACVCAGGSGTSQRVSAAAPAHAPKTPLPPRTLLLTSHHDRLRLGVPIVSSSSTPQAPRWQHVRSRAHSQLMFNLLARVWVVRHSGASWLRVYVYERVCGCASWCRVCVYVMYFTAVHCVCLGGRVVACVCAGGSGTSQRVIGFEAVLVVLSACVQDMCAFGWYVTAVHCGCV